MILISIMENFILFFILVLAIIFLCSAIKDIRDWITIKRILEFGKIVKAETVGCKVEKIGRVRRKIYRPLVRYFTDGREYIAIVDDSYTSPVENGKIFSVVIWDNMPNKAIMRDSPPRKADFIFPLVLEIVLLAVAAGLVINHIKV